MSDRALRHPHLIPIDLNDGPAALRYRKLTTPSLPDGAAALDSIGQAPISNPHR